MALASGTKLGPYEIQAPLGAGGMGEVYRAHDGRLDRTVAIKVLPASFSSDRDRLQRFAQEARAAAALNHPNILSIFDIGEENGAPYVVSELLEGETLRDRLRGGPIPLRKATDYALQVIRGLAAAHEKGIVHRDLKPENLFLTEDGRAKILDFGLAKLTLPATQTESGDAPTIQATEPGLVMGTVGYMAPEQVKGKPADARSDIFAFGAILYEMISGKRAFHGDSTAETMSSILKDDPPELTETNRNVSPALERIVRHCLEKNPAERFQSARDVAFNLEALTDISTTRPSGAVRAMPEETSSRRWLMPALGVLLLLASWAGVFTLARRGMHVANPTFHQITFRRGTIWAAGFAAADPSFDPERRATELRGEASDCCAWRACSRPVVSLRTPCRSLPRRSASVWQQSSPRSANSRQVNRSRRRRKYATWSTAASLLRKRRPRCRCLCPLLEGAPSPTWNCSSTTQYLPQE